MAVRVVWPVVFLLGVVFPEPAMAFLKGRSFCLFSDDDSDAPLDRSSRPQTTHWHRSLLAIRDRFGELVAPWALAVMVCVFASVITVIGFALQKKAVTGESKSPKYFKFFSITLSPMWVMGFVLVTLATFPCDLLAYTLAPLSLTAPLSGLTVVVNQVVAPYILTGEKVQLWPDVPACALIVIGIMLTTAAGKHQEGTITMDRLLFLAHDNVFLGNLLILVLVLWACLLRIEIQRHRLVSTSEVSKGFDVLMPAMVAAGAGGISNILLKALGELLKNGDTWQQCVWCSALCLLPAAMQLNFVNVGLRLYAQTLFVPVYSALLVLTNTFYGAVFYQEYSSLLIDSRRGGFFCLGVLLIISGLSLLMRRCPEDGPDSWIANADCQRAG